MTGESRSANAAQVQRWNGESGQYWIAHRERHLAGQQHLDEHLFAAAGISPGQRVLDVGCGCGATTIRAAQAARRPEPGPGGGGAVGLDVSAPMLKVARQLAARADAVNIGFIQGDAQACPMRLESFDAVISSFGVMFFDDPAAAFANIGTAVRRGGRLAFMCWQNDTHNELLSIPLNAFGAHTELPEPSSGDLFADPPQITTLLSGTGWDQIRVGAVIEPAWIGSDVVDVMSYVRGMPAIRGLEASLVDEALRERVFTRIADQYAARQRPDGIWVRAAAWLVTARRP